MDPFALLKRVSFWERRGERRGVWERRASGENIDQVQAAFWEDEGRTLKLLRRFGQSLGGDPAPAPSSVKPASQVFPP